MDMTLCQTVEGIIVLDHKFFFARAAPPLKLC